MGNGDARQEVDLTGQVAIVTGGGRGIGRAIAQSLAKAGAAVGVVARTAEQLSETVALIEEAGGRSVAIPTDVTNMEAVNRMVEEVEARLGPVDLLVNNAGVLGPGGPLWEVDPDVWQRCLDVNLRGPYLCSRAVLPSMVRRGAGRIVMVASSVGLGPIMYGSAYGVSKCALIRLAETLAREAHEHGVSVFAISPGFVRTAMTEGAAQAPFDEIWLDGSFRKRLSEGHDVSPHHAGDLLVRLASGEADALSGCFLTISSDIDEMLARAEEIQERDLYTLRLRTP